MERRFPDPLAHVEFWQIDDVEDAPPSVALPQLERGVPELVERLAKRTG